MKNTMILGIAIFLSISLVIPFLSYSYPFDGNPFPDIPDANVSQDQKNKINDVEANIKPDVIFRSTGFANSTDNKTSKTSNISFSLMINLEVPYDDAVEVIAQKRSKNVIRERIKERGNATYLGYLKIDNILYPAKPTHIDESINKIDAYLYNNGSYLEKIGNISINTSSKTAHAYIENKNWDIVFY